MRAKSLVAAVPLLLLAGTGPVAARQGPEPTDSSPERGAVVHRAPDEVSMTFSEPLDPSSHLHVTDECGRVVSGETEVVVDEMSTELRLKPSGHYEVQWSATGLAASGTNEGSWAFHVHAGESCKPDDNGNGNNNGNHHHGNGGPKGDGKHGHGDKHDGKRHPGGDHGGGDHSGTLHSPATHTGDDHDGGADHGAGHAGAGDHGGRHEGRGHGPAEKGKHEHHAGDRPDVAPDRAGDAAADRPTGASENEALNLLLVLLLPALLGTGGGALLRAQTAS